MLVYVLSISCLCVSMSYLPLVYVLSLSCLCRVHVLSLSCLCLVYVLSMSCLCLVYVMSMSCLCLIYVLSMFCLRICGSESSNIFDVKNIYVYYDVWKTIFKISYLNEKEINMSNFFFSEYTYRLQCYSKLRALVLLHCPLETLISTERLYSSQEQPHKILSALLEESFLGLEVEKLKN